MKYLALLFALAVTQCAAQKAWFGANVNGIASQDLSPGQTFKTYPASLETNANDLRYKRYEALIIRALERQGLTQATEDITPDIVVFSSWGSGAPRTIRETRSIPVFGRTGVSSSTTIGNATAQSTTYGNVTYGSATGSSTTIYNHSYGITGFQQQQVSTTSYPIFLTITAYFVDPKKEQADWHQAFETLVSGPVAEPDMDYFFPALVAAGADAFARDTFGTRAVRVEEGDSIFAEILNLESTE